MFFKPKRIKKLEEEVAHYIAESINYKNQLETETRTCEMLLEKNKKLEEECKKWMHKFTKCLKVGLKKDEKIEELENRIKELESDAYLRIPLKPQRVPKAEPMKIKSNSKLSNISRKHRKEVEQ